MANTRVYIWVCLHDTRTASQMAWVKLNGVLFLNCFLHPIRLYKAWEQLFANHTFHLKNKVHYLTLNIAKGSKRFHLDSEIPNPSATSHLHRTWGLLNGRPKPLFFSINKMYRVKMHVTCLPYSEKLAIHRALCRCSLSVFLHAPRGNCRTQAPAYLKSTTRWQRFPSFEWQKKDSFVECHFLMS